MVNLVVKKYREMLLHIISLLNILFQQYALIQVGHLIGLLLLFVRQQNLTQLFFKLSLHLVFRKQLELCIILMMLLLYKIKIFSYPYSMIQDPGLVISPSDAYYRDAVLSLMGKRIKALQKHYIQPKYC